MGTRSHASSTAQRSWRAAALAVTVVLVACGTDDETATTEVRTIDVEISTSTAAPTTATTTTTTVAPTTTPAPETTTSDPTSTVPPTTSPAGPTTTQHQVSADCDVDAMYALVDADLEAVRLAPGGPWSTDTAGVAFDDRTNDTEEFREDMGLDCMTRAVQRTEAGSERLLVAAWTGDRTAYTVQATDAPTTPYELEQVLQLYFEQPYGEWFEFGFLWAGTMQGGETFVVGTDDAPLAIATKSWQEAAPVLVDLPVTADAERYGIDLLINAGARNVSVAEPTTPGFELSALQMITPLGLHLIPTVGQIGWFDPAIELFPGEQTLEQVAGRPVYVTRAEPEAYAVGSTGWECDGHVWYVDSTWGSIDELLDWTEALITTAGCATTP